MRPDDWKSERGTAVMDTLEESRASTRGGRRGAALRAEDIDDLDEPEMYAEERGRRGVRLQFRAGLMPRSRWGKILAACGLVMVLGMAAAGFFFTRRFLLHDERFTIATSESIEIEGNKHLDRAQLLSVFGGDVERNIFNVSLSERRAELERLPWVQHATVMRLLPDHLRVLVVERVPVAFVREGGKIGMVDGSGVLLDMGPDEVGSKYSFPVVTGIAADDPMSTRGARMKIYAAFMKEMDSSGEKISEKLSEVDLSNPEDVKALIPEGSSDVMVHFGDRDYLARYRKFEEHLPEWRTQYPKLASADMRYDRQVVLEMQAGAPAAGDAPAADAGTTNGAVPDAGVAAPKSAATVETHVPESGHGAPGLLPVPKGTTVAPVKTALPAKAGAASKTAAMKAMLARGRVLKEQQKLASAKAAGKPKTVSTAEPSEQYQP